MQGESSTSSQVLPLLSHLATIILTVAGTLTGVWFKRKREPAEVAKIEAETRQIEVGTDLQLIREVTKAITKAERMKEERDHWERKADDLQKQVDLKDIEISSMDTQMRRMDGFIKARGLHLSDLDKPEG